MILRDGVVAHPPVCFTCHLNHVLRSLSVCCAVCMSGLRDAIAPGLSFCLISVVIVAVHCCAVGLLVSSKSVIFCSQMCRIVEALPWSNRKYYLRRAFTKLVWSSYCRSSCRCNCFMLFRLLLHLRRSASFCWELLIAVVSSIGVVFSLFLFTSPISLCVCCAHHGVVIGADISPVR